MNWEQVQGQLKHVGSKLKEKWVKLTDDDLRLLSGKKDAFVSKLQERAGLARDEAENQLDAVITKLDVVATTKAASHDSPN